MLEKKRKKYRKPLLEMIMNLFGFKTYEETIQHIAKRYDREKIMDLSSKMGFSHTTFYRWAKEYGIDLRRGKVK